MRLGNNMLNCTNSFSGNFFLCYIIYIPHFFVKFLGGHWYPCFGSLVISPLEFKARVGSAFFAVVNVMYLPSDPPLVLHLLTSWQLAHSWSLPHMHQQRWDLAWIQTGNHPHRRRTRYHCSSDPYLINPVLTNIFPCRCFEYLQPINRP